jgi:hypothetical protein
MKEYIKEQLLRIVRQMRGKQATTEQIERNKQQLNMFGTRLLEKCLAARTRYLEGEDETDRDTFIQYCVISAQLNGLLVKHSVESVDFAPKFQKLKQAFKELNARQRQIGVTFLEYLPMSPEIDPLKGRRGTRGEVYDLEGKAYSYSLIYSAAPPTYFNLYRDRHETAYVTEEGVPCVDIEIDTTLVIGNISAGDLSKRIPLYARQYVNEPELEADLDSAVVTEPAVTAESVVAVETAAASEIEAAPETSAVSESVDEAEEESVVCPSPAQAAPAAAASSATRPVSMQYIKVVGPHTSGKRRWSATR